MEYLLGGALHLDVHAKTPRQHPLHALDGNGQSQDADGADAGKHPLPQAAGNPHRRDKPHVCGSRQAADVEPVLQNRPRAKKTDAVDDLGSHT